MHGQGANIPVVTVTSMAEKGEKAGSRGVIGVPRSIYVENKTEREREHSGKRALRIMTRRRHFVYTSSR